MTSDRERWAEALAIEQQHGDIAPALIEERIRTLALPGDQEAVARWRAIAIRNDQLQRGGRQ